MLKGALHGIKWIAWSQSWVGGRPFGISSNTLECLSMTFLRSREIKHLDVWTYNENNCTITP